MPPPVLRDLEKQGTHGGVLGWLEKTRARLESSPLTPFDSAIGLAISIVVYLAMTFTPAGRHLWFDELFTYWIAQAPSLSQLLKDVRLDLQPPLSFLLVRGSIAMFGNSEFAARLPFLVFFLIGSLCLYRFVARRLRPVYGLLAMLVFWSTPFLSYATEARPYGLVIGFFGIAMLAWERAIQPRRSTLSILMLGLAVLGMMLSHFFSPFYIWPFCFAEMWRSYRSRQFDPGIWMALLVPAVVPIYYFSRVSAYHSMALPAVQQASPFKILAFFYHTLEPEGIILLLAVGVGLILTFRRERERVARTALMQPIDVAFTAGLLTMPVLLMTALIAIHGGFFPRYGTPTLFAYGLLIAFFVAMYTNINRLAAAAACCVLLAGISGTEIVSTTLATLRTWGKKPAASVQTPPLERVRPDLPLVAASGLTFLEMNKYENPATLSRLYYLSDRDLALRYAHSTLFEGSFSELKKYFPVRANFASYRQFVADHPHFLVLGTPDYPEDWLIRRLLDIHATLDYLGSFPVPYKDHDVYAVTMPGT